MSLRNKLAAYGDLMRHYGTVFRYYWKRRKELGTGLFTENEAEFLPAALSIQEKPVSPLPRLTAFTLILLLTLALAWSIVGRIDIVVNATGKVIPSLRTKTVSSVDIASVRALHVTEGQQVKAGDILVELDTSSPDAEHDKASGDEEAALLQVARSSALIEAIERKVPPKLPKLIGVTEQKWKIEQIHLNGQYSDFRAKLARIDGDILRYQDALLLATQRARDYQELSRTHDVSEHSYLEKEQGRIDLEGQLRDTRHQRVALLEETKRLAYDAMTDGNKVAAASRQDALRAGAHSQLLKLTAPVDGTVQQLNVHTVGSAVPAAQPLMLIVPRENHVEVEATLENKDIGFVQEGQNAEVKIDAFEYTKYGTIPARVTHVSRDAIQDEKRGLIYATEVTLARSIIQIDGKAVALSAGMSVNVEIKTGTRRVIEYVLSPLLQHQRESFNER